MATSRGVKSYDGRLGRVGLERDWLRWLSCIVVWGQITSLHGTYGYYRSNNLPTAYHKSTDERYFDPPICATIMLPVHHKTFRPHPLLLSVSTLKAVCSLLLPSQ